MSDAICVSKHSIHLPQWGLESGALLLDAKAERDAGPSFFLLLFLCLELLCSILMQWTMVWLCLLCLLVEFLTPACLQGLCSITELEVLGLGAWPDQALPISPLLVSR